MEIKYTISSKLLIVALIGIILSCSGYLIFIYKPLELLTKKLIALAPNTLFLTLWSSPPLDIYIEVYIFNVTNHKEFLAGKEKMNVTEIGPYVYKEILTNENATFNENGTVTFRPRRQLKFIREKSIGDPTVDWVMSPNIPLIGIASYLEEASMFTNLAFSTVVNMLNAQTFLNLTIDEYLWGYDDRLVTLAHKAIPSWIDFERFGIVERLMALDNGENVVTLNLHPDKLPASRSLNEVTRRLPSHIHRWNGSPGLYHWGYKDPVGNETVPTNSQCNMVEGAFEGSAFPQYIEKNLTVNVYRRAFCRSVPFRYMDETKTPQGISGYRYKLVSTTFTPPPENPDNACYCWKGKCLKKGLNTLAPCYYDIPIIMSSPHFLNGDPSLLEYVNGMKPNVTRHESIAIVHPTIGIPINAHLQIQINLMVGQTKYLSRTKPFNNKVLPLFWLKLSLDELSSGIYWALLLVDNIVLIQLILALILGVGGVFIVSGSAFWTLIKSRQESNGRLSFKGEYSPIPIITTHYFKPQIRISK